ncbi:hypothetical protein [Nocardia sp. CC227C]|uniref:hypothetical protein n=1 Tax=Nocardia sp. CC227C TaxID=3044562 RepID=UPI00278C6B90|nr:hypothetical protein [Nocardia sp. CC227C]
MPTGDLVAVPLASTAVPPAPAPPVVGGCADGDFRWTAVHGGIDMTPKPMTFTSVGSLRDCVGWPGITGGTFTGVHEAWSDCMRPADGPITVEIVWSSGAVSTVSGSWPVTMAQPSVGELEIVAGLGAGGRVRITAGYEMMTPEMIMGCLGPGVRTGVGWVRAAMLE